MDGCGIVLWNCLEGEFYFRVESHAFHALGVI